MKTAFAARLAALTLLAGSLAAAAPVHARPVEASLSSQVEECAGPTAARLDRSSDIAFATPLFVELGSEPELLGASLEPLSPNLGERARLSGCSPRRCQADAVFVGCCGRFRLLGYDSKGDCTVRQLCARD